MRALQVLAVGLLAGLVALGVEQTGWLNRVEDDLLDARFVLRDDRAPPKSVAIVGIDEDSFRKLQLQWPFPRSLHARVIDRLRRAGAKTVVYDVQFSEPSGDPAEDRALLRAARQRGVILGTDGTDRSGDPLILGGAGRLRAGGGEVGDARYLNDEDGTVREMNPEIEGVPTLDALATEVRNFKGPRLIDWVGEAEAIPALSFADVLRGDFDPADVRGRVVVVGSTAQNIVPDRQRTPRGVMAGPEIHANAVATALDGFRLGDLGGPGSVFLVLLAGLVAPVATLPGSRAWAPWRALIAGGVGAILLAVGAYLAFLAGVVIPVVVPALALLLGTAGATALTYATEVRHRRRVRATFERFVPAAVVGELLADGATADSIAPRELDATILFCDLRGFTSLAEKLHAPQVIAVLNRWLEEVSHAVLDREGTVVSFQGDGVMAAFGAPVPREDHAVRAVGAAREIAEERLPAFNAWLSEQGLSDQPLRIGVGVNSGKVMSGSVGSGRRLEYAAVGDATNVAARLQALSREDPAGNMLFVSETTFAELDALTREALAEHGEIELRGRRDPVKVWTTAD